MIAIQIDDQGLAHPVPVIEATSDAARLLDLADRLEAHAERLWRRMHAFARGVPDDDYPIGDGRGVIVYGGELSLGSVPGSRSEEGVKLWRMVRRASEIGVTARRLRLRVGPGVVLR